MYTIDDKIRRIASVELGVPLEKIREYESFDDSHMYDSLKLIQYVLSIERSFGVKIDLTDLYANSLLKFDSMVELLTSESTISDDTDDI